ncbi:hypothetical protein FB451DRAFT_1520804 [Mycena latifolia]|nr:hypothetical protein FB451DRAFT_1520804 [Mycena latifolia]
MKAGVSTFCVFDPHSKGHYTALSSVLELRLKLCLFGNLYSTDLAFLAQSTIQCGIENLALKAENAEMARQIEAIDKRRARRKENKKLEGAFSALGLNVVSESYGESGAPSPTPWVPLTLTHARNRKVLRSAATALQLAPIALPSSPDTLHQLTAPIEVECAVCMETYRDTSLICVDPCGHSFCRDCMASHAQSKIEARRYPITCPTCPTSAQHSAHPSVIREDVLTRLNIDNDHFNDIQGIEMVA